MAENDKSLIFPVGFEMDDAIQTAMEKFEKEKDKLEKLFNVTLKFKADMKSLDNLDDVQKRLKELKLEPVTPETKTAITELVAELKNLEDVLLKVDKLNVNMAKSTQDLAKSKSNTTFTDSKTSLNEAKRATEEANKAIKEQESLAKIERMRNESNARALVNEQKAADASVKSRIESNAKKEAIDRESMAKAMAVRRKSYSEKAIMEQKATEQILANKRKENAQLSNLERTQKSKDLVGAEQIRAAKARAEKAEELLTQAKQRGVDATNRQNKAYITQSGLLNGLKQSMNAYISIMGMTRLARSIREVTAEFELQKVALTAILQDKAEADKLFNQTVALAVKSPFQIKEMVGFNKQLAAYRIGTDELFDTTRRLADISAGLGVEMSRLILAYGQVSAASVLRGQEVRQFTEAGIPLIQLLADKFTELNGVATTTGDVFQLISERAVPFEMVKEIFQDMTNEGGIFYDMQRKQADTLHGVYSNLRDAWDVAFNEMGTEHLGLMKGIGEAMTNLGENWRTMERTITAMVYAFGAYKVATLLLTIEKKALTAQTLRLSLVEAQQSAKATKRIALIFGETSALKAQAVHTRILAIAKARLATANSGLSRSFWRLTTAMLSNPWGLLIAGLTAAAVGVYKYLNAESDIDRMHKKIAKSNAELRSSADSSVASFDFLMKRLKGATQGSQEYAETINEINRRYGQFLPEQLKVSQSYDEIALAVKGVTEALREKARADALSAGISEVEATYDATMSKARDKALKSLKGTKVNIGEEILTISSEQADDIWQRVVNTLRESPELYKSGEAMGSLMNDAINESMKDLGIDTNVITQGVLRLRGYRDAVKTVTEQTTGLTDEIDNAVKSVGLAFGKDNVKTFGQQIDDVKTKFEKINAENKKTLSLSEYKHQLQENEMKQLREMIAIYRGFEQYSLAEPLEKDLERLEGISRGWKNIVNRIIDEDRKLGKDRKGLSIFRVGDEDKIFEFTSNLRKEYKTTKEQLDELNKGLDMDDNGAEVERLTKLLEGMDIIVKALNIDLSETSKTPKGTNERAKAIEDEIKLLTEVYNKYNSLTADLSKGEAIKEIEKIYTAVPEGGFAFEEDDFIAKLKLLIDKLKKAGADASKLQKVNLDLFDFQIGPIQKKAQDSLKKMGEDIARQQEANKFFEKLIGAGAGVELATSMTINFYGFDANDIRDKMVKQLQDAMGGAELDLTPEGGIDFDRVLKNIESLPNVSDNTRKQLKQLAESIRKNDADAIESLYSSLSKYSEYEQKRIDILQKASDERKLIQQQGIGDAEKARLQEASAKKSAQDMATLEFDMFKNSGLYTTMFENLDKVSTSALNAIMLKLKTFKDANKENLDPTQIRELTKSFEDIEKKVADRNPFKAISDSLVGIGQAAKDAEQANKDIANSITLLSIEEENLKQAMIVRQEIIDKGGSTDTIDAEIEAISKEIRLREEQLGVEIDISNELKRRLSVIGDALIKVGQDVGGFADGFGAVRDVMADWGVNEETSQTMASLKDMQNALGGVSEVAGGVGKLLKLDFSGIGDIIKGASKAIQGFVGIFTGANRKIAKANKEIQKQAEIIENLSREYDNLRKAMDDALGSDFAKKSLESTALLEAQVIATQKQIQAEKSKGKKTDQEKIKELEKQQDELNQKIKESNKELSETMLGSDVGNTARDFARAWLDAYLSFDNTTDAIKEKFKSMLQNMIVESILAKAIEQRIGTLFKDAGAIWDEKGSLNMGNLNKIIGQIDSLPEDITKILDAVTKGINLEALRAEQEGSLTGLSKAVGSLSEETALVLAAAANSGLYYNVAQYNELVLIRDILLRWEMSRSTMVNGTDTEGGINNLIAVQNLALIELQQANISLTDIANSNREIHDLMLSVTSPLGSKSGTKALNVNI